MADKKEYIRFDWAVNDQISIGEDYEVIKKVYSINILYFNFGSGDDYAFHGVTTFRGMTNKNAELKLNTVNERAYMDSERRRMTAPEEVFPEYFLLIVDRFNKVARTPIEEWMAYLKDGAIRDDTTTPGLQEARRKLEYMSMTEQERREYRDYMVSVHAAKDAIKTAKADGWVEGRAEGVKEANRENAMKMKAKGYAPEDIAEIIGLSLEERKGLSC